MQRRTVFTVQLQYTHLGGEKQPPRHSLIGMKHCHPHPASITFLEQRGLISIAGIKTLDDFNCRICKESKSTVPHYQRGTRSIKRPGEVVHVDLVGPFSPDMYGCAHLMVFIDEASRHKSVFGLRTKYEAHKQLRPYQEGMQLLGVKVECVRGDGAGVSCKDGYACEHLCVVVIPRS